MESLRQPALVLVAPETFYSKICLIELNSMDTMVRQEEVKHMKKELQLKREKNRKNMNGGISEGDFRAHYKTSSNEAKGVFCQQDSLL